MVSLELNDLKEASAVEAEDEVEFWVKARALVVDGVDVAALYEWVV